MPGMPSFIGCDACHRSKKKCDGAKPTCARCVRRKLPCSGAGKRRFRFKDESNRFNATGYDMVANHSVVSTSRNQPRFMASPCYTPSNVHSMAVGRLISILDVTDPGYDVYCYGPIMGELPRRLGHNRALDASIEAFASTVSCSPTKQITIKAQRHYVSALNALHQNLKDPNSAYTVDTLAAIHLIIICNGWMQQKGDKSPNHGEAILHVMNHLIGQGLQDEAIVNSIVTATGALIRESIFDPTIDVQPWIRKLRKLREQYKSPIAEAALNKFTAAGFPLQSSRYELLARIPKLIRKPGESTKQVQIMYGIFRDEHQQLKIYGERSFPHNKESDTSPVAWLSYIRAKSIFQEAQCLVLALCLVFNSLMRDARPDDIILEKERIEFCANAVIMAEEGKIGRPFGALQVPLSTIAAWLSSKDPAQQAELLRLLDEYQGTFAMLHFLRQAAKWKDAPKRLRELPWFPSHKEAIAEVDAGQEGQRALQEVLDISDDGDCEKCCIL